MLALFKSLFTKSPEAVPAQVLLDMEGMHERNLKRIEAIKAEMGDKWILAKCHMKSKLDEPRPV